MREVFADAAYWIALLNPKDSLHHEAQAASTTCGPVRLVTSDLILVEVLNGLAGKGSAIRCQAVKLVHSVRASSQVHVEPATEGGFRAALELYKQRSDKEWGLVDCSSITIMNRRGIKEALTCDHHFEQAGFTILLKKK